MALGQVEVLVLKRALTAFPPGGFERERLLEIVDQKSHKFVVREDILEREFAAFQSLASELDPFRMSLCEQLAGLFQYAGQLDVHRIRLAMDKELFESLQGIEQAGISVQTAAIHNSISLKSIAAQKGALAPIVGEAESGSRMVTDIELLQLPGLKKQIGTIGERVIPAKRRELSVMDLGERMDVAHAQALVLSHDNRDGGFASFRENPELLRGA